MRLVDRLIVHHSGQPDGPALSWAAIRRHHVEVRGWQACGYHGGAELVGSHYEVLIGRPLRIMGAHARGANEGSVGFCFLGNFRSVPPVLAQLEAGAEWIADVLDLLGLDASAIVGHSQASSPGYTECPGAAFPLVRLREMVAVRLG